MTPGEALIAEVRTVHRLLDADALARLALGALLVAVAIYLIGRLERALRASGYAAGWPGTALRVLLGASVAVGVGHEVLARWPILGAAGAILCAGIVLARAPLPRRTAPAPVEVALEVAGQPDLEALHHVAARCPYRAAASRVRVTPVGPDRVRIVLEPWSGGEEEALRWLVRELATSPAPAAR